MADIIEYGTLKEDIQRIGDGEDANSCTFTVEMTGLTHNTCTHILCL